MNRIGSHNKISKILIENFKINQGGYEGLWTSFFVKPLGWAIIQIGKLVHNYGLALIIMGILIRLALYPITASTTKQTYIGHI